MWIVLGKTYRIGGDGDGLDSMGGQQQTSVQNQNIRGQRLISNYKLQGPASLSTHLLYSYYCN